MLYSLLCYIACMLYSTRQGVICIRCYIASYMATTKVPDDWPGNLNIVNLIFKLIFSQILPVTVGPSGAAGPPAGLSDSDSE